MRDTVRLSIEALLPGTTMMPFDDIERWRRVDALFSEALALHAEDRTRFLARECAGDDALLAEVQRLLSAHLAAATFLDEPPRWLDELKSATLSLNNLANGFGAESIANPDIGRQIGPYELVRELGRGGMGTVYLARRADGQFSQRVALKRIRRGLDSEAAVARFRLERQILARLEHPKITRLVDGGIDVEGYPFLVMEYVEGVPLTRYCDDRRLSVPERLELFSAVCQAVHYAHRNLIVHRDLKPSNILVTADGEVKLLDFGIAKLLDDDWDDLPLVVTQTGVRLLTPNYASPEQIQGTVITTASDVYALGVILYELLTGQLPHHLSGKRVQDVERAIRETEPERPSQAITRTYDSGAKQPLPSQVPDAVGYARSTSVDRLRKQLSGDLDTIVLMALRKEPERRYASAEQFVEDIRRYVAGRPVLARKDTFGYRASKFVRRNKAAMLSAVAVLLALVGGLSVALWQARIAGLEAARARRINEFLQDMLSSADATKEGSSVTVAEVLDAAAVQLEDELRDQPEIEGDLRNTLGITYKSLGLFEKAEQQLRRAVNLRESAYGRESPEAARTLGDLALVLQDQGKFDESETLSRRSLEALKRSRGSRHADFGEQLNNLGYLLSAKGKHEEAAQHFREAISVLRGALAANDPDLGTVPRIKLAYAIGNLGNEMRFMSRFPEAERHFKEAYEIIREEEGADHFDAAISLSNIALTQEAQGKRAEAEVSMRESLAIMIERVGEEHPNTAISMSNLAGILSEQQKFDEAETYHLRALEIRRELLGDRHVDVAVTLNGLAGVQFQRGQLAKAAEIEREAVSIAIDNFGPEHPLTAKLSINLAGYLHEDGKLAEAEQLYRDNLFVLQGPMPDDRHTAKALTGLGILLIDRGDAAEAEPLLREAIRIRPKALPEGDWLIAESESALGAAVATLRRYDEARPLLENGYRSILASRGTQDPSTRRALSFLQRFRDRTQ